MTAKRGAGYAELHCLSNFSFLRGASHPAELVTTAAELGYAGLALTDECSVAGVVRAHGAAKRSSFKLVVGSEFSLERLKIVVLVPDREAYASLCRLITAGRRAAPKGTYHSGRADLERYLQGSSCLLLWVPEEPDERSALRTGEWLKERCGERLWLAAELLNDGCDRQRLREWRGLGKRLGIRLVASGNVHMHCRERRMLRDTLTAIRLGKPLDELGFELRAECGTRFAAVAGARAPLPARIAERDSRDSRTLQLLPRRAALRISARARAGRRDAGQLFAPPRGARQPLALAERAFARKLSIS